MHTVLQCRQHAICPNRRFGPRPPRAYLSVGSSPRTKSPPPRHCARSFFRRSSHLTSTFLRPFAPPALPGFYATMDALTPEWPALRRPRPAIPRQLYSHELRPYHHSGLPALRVWPSEHSASNHLTAPVVALTHNPSARQASSGLRLARAGSPVGPAESSSYTCGLSVHLQLLPTSSHENAVTFDYRPECAYLKRTRTSLTKHAHRRTRARASSSGTEHTQQRHERGR